MEERCFVSLQDKQECIDSNDFLCIGFDISNIDNRSTAFPIISYKTFIRTNKNIYGPANENINHIFPLFLTKEHWQSVKNNLDIFFQRYDYHKYPFRILAAIRKKMQNTEYHKKINNDITQVCQLIIKHYNMETEIKENINNFINYPTARSNTCLTLFLTHYYLLFNNKEITELRKISLIVIEEQLRRFAKKIPSNIILELLGIKAPEYIKKYLTAHIKNIEFNQPSFNTTINNFQLKYIESLNDLFADVVKQTKLIEIIDNPKNIFGKQYDLTSIMSYEQILAMGIQFNFPLTDVNYTEAIFNIDLANAFLKNMYQNNINSINKLCQAKLLNAGNIG